MLKKGIFILAPNAAAHIGEITIFGNASIFDHRIFGAGLGFVKGQGMWVWDQTTNQYHVDLYDNDVATGNNIGEIYGNWVQQTGGFCPNLPWFSSTFTGNMNLVDRGGNMRALAWIAL